MRTFINKKLILEWWEMSFGLARYCAWHLSKNYLFMARSRETKYKWTWYAIG